MCSRKWWKHLLGCQRKGREAHAKGVPRDGCPYTVRCSGFTNDSGAKNLTKQRREYWLIGWDDAAKHGDKD